MAGSSPWHAARVRQDRFTKAFTSLYDKVANPGRGSTSTISPGCSDRTRSTRESPAPRARSLRMWLRVVVGVVLCLVGVVWIGQGVGLIHGSFMTGEVIWA